MRISSLEKAITELNAGSSFAFYDLQLLDPEEQALKALKINETRDYNNYGNLKDLESKVALFIQSLSPDNEATSTAISSLIARLVDDILKACRTDTAWIAVRSFTPTPQYDVPRWHMDGYYFEPYEGDPYKFAITLKGPSTLFANLSATQRKRFYDLQIEGAEEDHHTAEPLVKISQGAISSAMPYQGAVFLFGSERAAIHSEPPTTEERLFMSVLPGTQNQIKEWGDK